MTRVSNISIAYPVLVHRQRLVSSCFLGEPLLSYIFVSSCDRTNVEAFSDSTCSHISVSSLFSAATWIAVCLSLIQSPRIRESGLARLNNASHLPKRPRGRNRASKFRDLRGEAANGDTKGSRQTFRRMPSCVSAVAPSSSPFSSTIFPFTTLRIVIPVNRIFRPVSAGSDP